MSARFGPFVLERLLGRGGMAEAFLARRSGDPSPLVLKRIRPDHAGSAQFLRRFVLEAQVASRLAHRNLARFREFGRVGDCHYIVMDQARGHSLHRLLEKAFAEGARLPAAAALHVGAGLAGGLSTMHRVMGDDGRLRPMLHRDVTPANVILDLQGEPVIIDFGIAKDVAGPALTLPGQVIGTGRYMAPEHRRAEYIDARADVFSASVVLFELFCGRHPWPPLHGMKELLRTDFDPPEIPSELASKLPAPVIDVILRGLACSPADRPADALALAAELGQAARACGLDPAEGATLVRAWVADRKLVLDEALTTPVIDHGGPEEGEPLVWSSSGSVSPPGFAAVPAPADVLRIPPLPPRRDEGLDLDAAQLAALGRRRPWLAVAALLAVAASLAWLVLVR